MVMKVVSLIVFLGIGVNGYKCDKLDVESKG